jgi:hypothetical protein
MLALFWDISGPIHEHYQQKGKTVNSARYSTMLEEEVKPVIRSRRHGILSKRILLLHDNAQPHTAAATVTTFQKVKFETMYHPLYTLDFAPSVYHRFITLKEALRGRRFHSGDEAKEEVHFLASTRKNFFFST